MGWCPLEAVPHESIHRSPTSSTQRWLENPNGNGCFFNVLTGASWCPPSDVCWFTNHRNSIDISTINHSWLVVWNMNGLFVHSAGNVIIPTGELHHFSEGFLSTPNQILISITCNCWAIWG